MINSGKLFHREEPTNEIAFQQTFVGLQHVFSVTILRLPRRLEDVLRRCLEDVLKTS